MQLLRFGYLPDYVLQISEQAVGGLQEQLPRVGQRHFSAPAVEEHAAQLLLQQLDLTADRRL